MSWPMVRRVERRARRMHDMIERLGVDPLTLVRRRQGGAYADARTACLHCSASMECAIWLASTEQPGGPPEFCPNLPLFESCMGK